MKLLIIPSWYPTPTRPLNGSYFKEQAQFLHGKEGLDIRILYGERKSQSLLYWIRIYIRSWFRSTWLLSKEIVEQNPPALGFLFPANRRVPDFLQIGLERRLFWEAYQSLIRTGWMPDLIHAQSGMDAGIFAHDISKKTSIPYVLIEHQIVIFHHYSRKRAGLVLGAYKNAYKLGVVSRVQKRQILIHEPSCDPVVLPNLVDETRFVLSQTSRTSSFRILTIMYPNTIKGYHTFFESMKKLKEKGMDFKFTVVGKGGYIFEQEILNCGLSGYGELIENLDRNEILGIFSNSDIYVCSSDFETFGIAPREAMMCGLPVVSTANGGVEDSINAKTGLLVPVRDVEAMADAIFHLKENYQSYNSEVIRAVMVAQCGRKAFLDSMLKFYQV